MLPVFFSELSFFDYKFNIHLFIPDKSVFITFLINFLISDEEDNQEIETDDIKGVLYAKINIGSVP